MRSTPFTQLTHLRSKSAPLALAALALSVPWQGLRADPALQEVVVTAQKREESLQKTPISLVTLDAGTLETRGINDIRDLPSAAPNLQTVQQVNSASSVRLFIRGVGNFDDQITQDPSVAVYTDGVYVARSQGLAADVADIERIEVLRGPQGTLYGRNATGGAINFVTKAPQLGEWAGSETLTFGSYDEVRSKTLLNIPITDTAAARLSYVKADKDGFVRNEGTGASRFGDEDRQAWRVDLRWQPISQLDLRYTYDQSQFDDTSPYLVKSPLNGSASRPTKSNPLVRNFKPNDVSVQGHALTATYEIADNFSLKSISAYRMLDNFDYQDYLAGQNGAFTPLTTLDDLHQKQWSQEFQLLGNTDDNSLQYIAGLYYFHETGSGTVSTGVPVLGTTGVVDQNIANTAKALFGQATYTPEILDQRLHVTIGTRWSRDRREASIANSSISPVGLLTAGSTGAGDRSFSNFSPALTVAFDVNDDINVYAKYAEGYKSGGFNIRATTVARFDEGFDPEKLKSYELGAKTQWWENRVRLNAALFHADYDDIQLTAPSSATDPSKSDVLNAGKATLDGVELELTALPTDDLTVNVNYAYLDDRYDSIKDAFGRDITSNYVFLMAPHNTFTFNLDYAIAETPIGKLSANANYSWEADKFSTATTTINGKLYIQSYGLLNGRLTLAEIPGVGAGNLKVSLWGKNLEDKHYSVLQAPLFGGYRVFGDPRSVGVEIAYAF